MVINGLIRGHLQEDPHGQVAILKVTILRITFDAMLDTMLEQQEYVIIQDLVQGRDGTAIVVDGISTPTLHLVA
jgi:hypothetical protein